MTRIIGCLDMLDTEPHAVLEPMHDGIVQP